MPVPGGGGPAGHGSKHSELLAIGGGASAGMEARHRAQVRLYHEGPDPWLVGQWSRATRPGAGASCQHSGRLHEEGCSSINTRNMLQWPT